jgi:hypothetical protein
VEVVRSGLAWLHSQGQPAHGNGRYVKSHQEPCLQALC